MQCFSSLCQSFYGHPVICTRIRDINPWLHQPHMKDRVLAAQIHLWNESCPQTGELSVNEMFPVIRTVEYTLTDATDSNSMWLCKMHNWCKNVFAPRLGCRLIFWFCTETQNVSNMISGWKACSVRHTYKFKHSQKQQSLSLIWYEPCWFYPVTARF